MRKIKWIIVLVALVGMVLTTTFLHRARAVEQATQARISRQERIGAAMRSLINDAAQEDRLLPKIENQKVVGAEPKSVSLLSYIVDDYKGRVADGKKGAIQYCAHAGGGDPENSASAVIQFQSPDKPVATVFLTIGPEIRMAESATLVLAQASDDGVRDVVSTVSWDVESKRWTLSTRSGPGPNALEVQHIQ